MTLGAPASLGGRSPSRLGRRAGAAALGLGLALAAWWLAIEWLVTPGTILSRFAPADALATLARLLGDGDLSGHVLASLRRIVGGLVLAAVLGIPLGLALGSAQLLARVGGPVLGILRMISPLAWTPVAIIIFGVGDAPVVFLIAVGAAWPIMMSTQAGVVGLDQAWLRVSRSLGATRWESLRHVVWPGIRANILTGLRIATGLAWVILVPAEMLGVDSGLGYFILDARDRFAYDELVAAIIVIGVLGLGIDVVARTLFSAHRRRSPWRAPLADRVPGSGGSAPAARSAARAR